MELTNKTKIGQKAIASVQAPVGMMVVHITAKN